MKHIVAITFGILLFFFGSFQANAQVCDTILADFSSNAPRCTSDSVDFVFTQTPHAGLTYLWDFGVGATPATSTLQNPSNISYSSPGLKLITLTVTHAGLGCTHTKTSGISIIETPNPSFTDNGPRCEEDLFTFTYTGTDRPGWIYSWDFGSGANPAVASSKDPTGVTYTGSGTKNVSLTVTNGSCAANINNNVTVLNKPDAGFSLVSPSCTNDNNTFTNVGTTGISYQWNFGSGATPATSTAENPANIAYSTSGSKTIQQIVTQGTCSDTSIQSMSVTETPAPTFTSTAPQCEGTAVDFTYTGSTGTGWTYSWDFGAGSAPSVATSSSPAGINYSGAGTKNVSLTVTNLNCSETINQNITIDITPQSGFSSSSPACSGDSVNFSNTGSTGATYSWDFGANATPSTSTVENPLGIIYSVSGIKTVRQIVTLGTCRDTSFNNVDVTETAIPNFTHTAPQCEGANVDFTYTGTTGTGWTYLWDFGQGASPAISTAENPTGIQYSGPGTKTVTLTVTNQFCSETVTQNITINPTPSSGFSSNAPGCTGDSVNFLNTGTSGVTYNWDFGSGATPTTSTVESPLGVIYATSGIKTVRQILTQGTCNDTTFLSINLTETPAPSFTNVSTCQGLPHDFTYTGTSGTNWTYSWDFGTGSSPRTSTSTDPKGILYGNNATTTPVTVTVTNMGCSETFEDSAYIEFTPTASITAVSSACSGDSIAITGGSGSISEWSFTGTPASSNLSTPPLVVFQPGNQTASLKVTEGNCSDSTSVTITVNETPTVSIQSNAPVCAGSGVSVFNQGSSGSSWNYIWDFGLDANPSISTAEVPSLFEYSTGGMKTVNLTISSSHCSFSDSAQIEIHTLPVSNAGLDTTICADECVQLGDTANPNYSYSWFPSSNLDNSTISNPTLCPIASINTYLVTTTDTNSCVSSDTVIVTMLPSAIAKAGPDVSMCVGESVQIGAALIEGQTYSWTPSTGLDSANIPSPTASPDSTTLYQVAVSYQGCEEITDEVLVTVHQNPVVSAGDDVTIAEGASAQLLATGAVMYSWTPTDGLSNPGVANPLASPAKTTTYSIEFTDINSCISYDTLTVTVTEANTWAPEAFTPNGDGRNDLFYVRVKGHVTFELLVFNRNGNLLFRSTDPNIGWDGTKQGTREASSTGAYVYSAKGELSDGKAFRINGIVNLIR